MHLNNNRTGKTLGTGTVEQVLPEEAGTPNKEDTRVEREAQILMLRMSPVLPSSRLPIGRDLTLDFWRD